MSGVHALTSWLSPSCPPADVQAHHSRRVLCGSRSSPSHLRKQCGWDLYRGLGLWREEWRTDRCRDLSPVSESRKRHPELAVCHAPCSVWDCLFRLAIVRVKLISGNTYAVPHTVLGAGVHVHLGSLLQWGRNVGQIVLIFQCQHLFRVGCLLYRRKFLYHNTVIIYWIEYDSL